MYKYTLLDGSQREFENQLSGLELAKSISESLSKKIIAIKINNELADLNDLMPNNCKIELITKDHVDALQLIRHDCAHVLAEAVQNIFPDTQVTIGPVIENGFYYDFLSEE